jgi:hypothetical protein
MQALEGGDQQLTAAVDRSTEQAPWPKRPKTEARQLRTIMFRTIRAPRKIKMTVDYGMILAIIS